jgi:hypothetical protein
VKIESVCTQSMLQALAAIAQAICEELESPRSSSLYPVVASLEVDTKTLENEISKQGNGLSPFRAVADIRIYDGQEQGPDAEEWHFDDWAALKFDVTLGFTPWFAVKAAKADSYVASAVLIPAPGQAPVKRTERAPDPIAELMADKKLNIVEAE